MSKKTFYIIPNTKGYYESLTANSKEDALVEFADKMDQIAAYFDAVEEIPVSYPHGYEHPEGKFELALSIIMATMLKDKSSTHYVEGACKGLNLHIDVISSLQYTYEELKKADRHAALKSRKHFYKVLCDITGIQGVFQFNKKETPDSNKQIRIHTHEDFKKIAKVLKKKDISYDIDSDNHILIVKKDLKRTLKAFTKADIDFIVI